MTKKISAGLGKKYKAPKLDLRVRAPRLNIRWSDYPEAQRQKTIEEISHSDRYQRWQDSHPYGTQYDFEVHDFLQFNKKLTENVDFHWHASASDLFLDYYFPARQMGWLLSGRLNADPTVTARAGGYGIHVVYIKTNTLSEDPIGTLNFAWMGVER